MCKNFFVTPLKFLLNTFGSLGDLHPYIAVGQGLRDRGHLVTLATSEAYRARVEGAGLNFQAIRPDIQGLAGSPGAMECAYHPRTGSEYIMRRVFLPHLTSTYSDLVEPARQADLLVGHPLAFAIPTLAEVLGKPWVSVILQPVVILSAWDPPSVSGAPFLEVFRKCGPGFWRVWGRMARAIVRKWGAPVNALRVGLGLKDLRNPVLDDMFSPFGNQGWFSPVMASPQPDWPVGLSATGFPFYDKPESGEGLSQDLERFLAEGEPPVVFTLGSSAVLAAGTFFHESVLAVQKSGLRAVLLVGSDPRNQPLHPDARIFVADYAPFSELFGRAAAVVHQGGSGTTAQALRAGVPSVFVPYSHDQPDNARRVASLGAARIIPRSKYRAARIVSELRSLLSDISVKENCRRIAQQLAGEDGVRTACEGLEKVAMQFRDVANRSPEK